MTAVNDQSVRPGELRLCPCHVRLLIVEVSTIQCLYYVLVD